MEEGRREVPADGLHLDPVANWLHSLGLGRYTPAFAEAEVEYRATLALAPTWREAAIRAELTLARRTLECRCENCVAMRASAARAGGAALKRPPSSHSVVSSTA